MATTTTAEARRTYAGPALFGFGFRPFFLLAAIWAVVSMILWIGMLSGHLAPPSHLSMIDWHVHSLLFGFVPSVIAGFLMTAIPNWTGRMPVYGWPLALLAGLWLAGRAALLVSAAIGPVPAIVIDLSFLAALAAVAGREIAAGRNWRNLKVLVPVLVLLIANGIFHVEALGGAAASGLGMRLGLSAALFLIMLVGGRIIPSFTRNWLAQHNPGRLPVPFGRFDAAALATALVALSLWVAVPASLVTALACAAAGILHTYRLVRWAGHRTAREPLLLVLHIAYAFVPAGFLLTGLAGLAPAAIGASTALHAWTAGAVGLMTLSVMIRATRGHSGRALTAPPGTVLILGAVLGGALLRIAAPYLPVDYQTAIAVSGTIWVAGFGGFVLVYWTALCRRPLPTQ